MRMLSRLDTRSVSVAPGNPIGTANRLAVDVGRARSNRSAGDALCSIVEYTACGAESVTASLSP